MDDFSNFKNFCLEHKGAIIGGLIAIIIACTGLYKLFLIFIVIAVGIYGGNYVQKNKEFVKEKLKNFIDKF